MSYTTFDYSDLDVVVNDITDPVAFTAHLTITNTGERQGAEVVQLYVSDRSGVMTTPDRELRGFAKVALEPAESRALTIEVARRDLEHYHTAVNRWVYAGGPITVFAGSSSRDLRLTADATIPGDPLDVPLTVWSNLREWYAHPVAGPRLKDLIKGRGGLKGRLADLLADEAGQDSVLGQPVLSLIEFPGVPIDDQDVKRILETIT